MSQGGSNKKVSNSLLALSSAAILAVYTAGYSRTRPAAERFAVQAEVRRPAVPVETTSTSSAHAPAPAAPEVKRDLNVQPRVAAPSKPQPATTEIPLAPAEPVPAHVEAPAAEPAPVIAEPKVEAPAAAPEPPVPAPAPPPPPKWKDGTFTGWGTSRHGDIEASVVVEGGHILSAKISQCLTRYSCDVIAELPPQVSKRQSPEVDFVSGATQSANAFYYAVVDALAKAK